VKSKSTPDSTPEAGVTRPEPQEQNRNPIFDGAPAIFFLTL